ncbi:MAG: DNA primase catalytic subunit PriS, partial [Thermoproteus sp.]|nr:DNA primase catalytic subunit PriS [Thermoproteus sp.]
HVRSAEVRGLSAVERRKLVDFLLARNLDLSKFKKRIKKKYIMMYNEEPIGSLARIKSGKYSIHIDEVVTADVHRLIRLPKSLHNKTGLIAQPIDLNASVERIIQKAIAFKGTAKVKLKAPVSEVLGEKINGKPGDKVVVPTYIAVYLYLQDVADFEVSHKNSG